MQIKKRCGKINCRNFVEDVSQSYCEKHKGYTNKQYNDYREKYEKEYVSFYKSTAWVKKRKQALRRDEYLCRRCKDEFGLITIATLVDHIVPSKVEWELRLDIDNLQAMCDECHAIKTAEDKIKYNL